MYPDVMLFVNGQWQPAADGGSLDVVNPATEEVIGQVARAGQADLDKALDAASTAFATWRITSPLERGKTMRRAAELLRERADHIAGIMTREQGKPLAQARAETLGAADTIDWFAGEAQRTYGQLVPARQPDVQQQVSKRPVGVVAAFTPWNFPINQVVRKLSAALAAGCTIIVKGPEETPGSPAELVRAFADAGVPAGVINLVYGVPADISEYLIPHPKVAKISFTGSTPVGKHLAALAGQHMKRATMELGGHAPVLVFEDADLDVAAREMALAKFRNAGQVCIAPTRFLIQDAVYDTFIDKFAAEVRALRQGDGLDEGTTIGPMIHGRGRDNIEAFVNDAVEKGAQVVTGGKRGEGKGFFFEPTVLKDVPASARAWSEEPFGPVALFQSFSEYDEAVAEANRLPFGLAAYAYARDHRLVAALGRDVECGMLTINHNGLGLPEAPFGGIKDSGYGTEGGSEAIESYLELRYVTQAAR
ncbi:NAD-dependent succinate-semialdehyde dehydrogenase [Larsenimonas rhizosphaerae]|uniref:NAD-dependent succinate-semialdehyde dehydrogenase n=1 Tax=Larsenimonas rhizosphaerae TaxID=2944682 RepID=A0AA42CXV0_9GAMM|nr:NAD-dependent succinate-semialdehyde dehydrogenase [Larsenimonas rhizosphaerae]MCM2129642.1 NAD-dependent succinate-semialdehyde dehydrogenase [Larsenimonas rhizosphaerae]MCX2524300.1 NAD-dependent succinate-semialdehyde dehydrogenase [Larsenimonas rhizosphaerae]